MPLVISPLLAIDDSLLSERFIRSSGPGGQNVNKVSTAVELRFDIGASPLSDDVRRRLRLLAGSRLIANEDVLVIDSREHRVQSKNRDAARERLAELILQALVVPRRRRKTKPTTASKVRRLESKVKRSRVKERRSSRVDRE